MLLSQCIEALKVLKLEGMAQSLEQLAENPEHHALSLAEGLSLLISNEQVFRDNRRRNRLLKQAKLRFQQATIETIDYHHPRELNKSYFLELTQCQWIRKHLNLVFLGATGLGKSYLACALSQQACRLGFSVRYYRMSKLLELLRQAHADGTYPRFLIQLSKIQLLVLDDWGIDQLDRVQRNDILEIIEDRYQNAAMIITSQLPVLHWHQYIGDQTIADAILDRLLSHAVQIHLKGDSMRKKSAENEKSHFLEQPDKAVTKQVTHHAHTITTDDNSTSLADTLNTEK